MSDEKEKTVNYAKTTPTFIDPETAEVFMEWLEEAKVNFAKNVGVTPIMAAAGEFGDLSREAMMQSIADQLRLNPKTVTAGTTFGGDLYITDGSKTDNSNVTTVTGTATPISFTRAAERSIRTGTPMEIDPKDGTYKPVAPQKAGGTSRRAGSFLVIDATDIIARDGVSPPLGKPLAKPEPFWDLPDDEQTPPADDVPVSEIAAPQIPGSRTALVMNDWASSQGTRVIVESKPVRDALGVNDAHERLMNGASNQESRQALKRAADTAADFFASTYQGSPEFAPTCDDPCRAEYLKTLLDSSEMQALRHNTIADVDASAIAAAAFTEEYAAYCKQEGRDPSGEPNPDWQDDHKGDPIGTGVSAYRATQRAAQDVKDYKDAADACGLGPGSPGGAVDRKRIGNAFRRVKDNATLLAIIKKCGRLFPLADSIQRSRVKHGDDELVGIRVANDAPRLLPSELALMGSPATQEDALRRFAEAQTLCRHFQDRPPIGRGPFVFVCDESGSMSGDRIITAKAIALTMARVARKQKRWCALVAFSGGTKGRTLLLKPGHGDENALLDWLVAFLSGGTTCDVPLSELPKVMWPHFLGQGMPRGKTDIVCVTDCQLDAPPDVRDYFNGWKKANKATLRTIVVGAASPGDMALVSDHVFAIPALGDGTDALKNALGT